MIKIDIAHPDEEAYGRVSNFAHEVLLQRIQHSANPNPNVFIYAHHKKEVIGCVGLYYGDTRPEMLFEMCDPSNAYERLAGASNPDRSLLGELGTRAVRMPEDLKTKSCAVSIILTGVAITAAHARGIRYVGFVSNRKAQHIAASLGVELTYLGVPDFSKKDALFQKNVLGFLRVQQYCFGAKIESVAECVSSLNRITRHNQGLNVHINEAILANT